MLIYCYWSLSLILHGGAESSRSLWLCLNCPIYYSPIIFGVADKRAEIPSCMGKGQPVLVFNTRTNKWDTNGVIVDKTMSGSFRVRIHNSKLLRRDPPPH